MERARRQHAGYGAALEAAGFAVEELAADEAHPDSPFVEDAAVVHGGRVLITRPGAASRRDEVGAVAAALEGRLPLSRVAAPATLDGGDVLVVGDIFFVGRSTRTDGGGVASVRAFAGGRPVTAVPVAGVLHLQSAVTMLDDETVLGRSDAVDPSAFSGLRWIEAPPGERQAANVLALGGGVVLVPAGYPATAAALEAVGADVVPVDVSEFAKADGGLTCLSLRW